MTVFSVFHGIAQLFLNTFVVSFLIRNSLHEIISVSLYDLFFYLAIMLSFVLMVGQCKRGNIKFVFAMHLVVQMVLIVAIALLGARVPNWVVLLGILHGIQHSFYSMSQQQMVIEKVPARRMLFFSATNSAVTGFAKILMPIILGTLISVSSLQNIAWVLVLMGVTEMLLLWSVSFEPCACTACADLIGFMKRGAREPWLKKLFLAEFLRGVAFELESVGVLYIVYVFHSDFQLGVWTTVFAIITATMTWVFGRFCSKHDYGWVVGISSVLLLASIGYLMCDVNRFSALAYAGAVSLGITMMDQVLSINVLNMAKTKFVTRQYRAEYLAARQVVSFVGRWGGIIALMYIGVFGGYVFLPYLVVILALFRIAGAILFVNIGKYIDEDKD